MTENTDVEGKRPVAYSYVRFSTPGQLKGDSLRRQVEECEAYCRENGLDLHPASYRDLGVSAFKKKNIEKGALAAFIDAVRTGKVEKGSYLVIEQFDRLSRAEVDVALRLLLDLVHSGIVLVTLVDKKVWDKAAVKDIGNLILAIVFMSRANNESEMKADRIAKAWGKKKERAALTGEVVTKECPRWLVVNADRTGFDIIPERVESIRKVFDLRINGFGISSIVSRANKEGWPAPGKSAVQKSGETSADFELRKTDAPTWHTSTVGRLLKNRALLGEYQPHENGPDDDGARVPVGEPIKGYYPAVIDETTFLRAQAKAERSGRFPGRRDASLKNWLQGLLKCTCGHSFVRKNKDSKAQPEYARYYCTARNRRISDCPGANAKELETAVLHVVSTVAPQYFEGTQRMEDLKARADVLEVDVAAATQMRDRYVEAIGGSRAPISSLIVKLNEAEAALEKAQAELSSVRAELADLAGDSDTVFENIVKAVKSVDSLDARAALREELSRIIEKAVVHQNDGYLEVHFRGFDVPVIQPLRPTAILPGMQMMAVPEDEYAQFLASRQAQ